MIDLHIHSACSDGDQTVAGLFAQAKENGIRLLALTDHDTTRGIPEASAAAQAHGVRFVRGIEITAVHERKTIHILAHGCRQGDPALEELLSRLRDGRRNGAAKRLNELNEEFRTAGKPEIDIEGILASVTHYALPTIGAALVARGHAADLEEGKRILFSMKVRSDDITAEVVIRAVRAAGGLATFAHPFAPRISLRNLTQDEGELRTLARGVAAMGLDGMEVYTPAHRVDDIRLAADVARELGLLATIGSDWHGPYETKDATVFDVIPRYPTTYRGFLAGVPEDAQEVLLKHMLERAE